jgi:hypothetical protein
MAGEVVRCHILGMALRCRGELRMVRQRLQPMGHPIVIEQGQKGRLLGVECDIGAIISVTIISAMTTFASPFLRLVLALLGSALVRPAAGDSQYGQESSQGTSQAAVR